MAHSNVPRHIAIVPRHRAIVNAELLLWRQADDITLRGSIPVTRPEKLIVLYQLSDI